MLAKVTRFENQYKPRMCQPKSRQNAVEGKIEENSSKNEKNKKEIKENVSRSFCAS